jgi:hypothetical protein
VDTSTNQIVATLAAGATIRVTSGNDFNIKADVAGSVGSILFSYGSVTRFQVESTMPYAFCGDTQGVYRPCPQLIAGTHTITATPFSASGAAGSRETTYAIMFLIVVENSAPAPTPAPVNAPSSPAPISLVPTPIASLTTGPAPTHSLWFPAVPTPVIAVGAAHLPDGKLLMWASRGPARFGIDPSIVTWTAIYNPVTGG